MARIREQFRQQLEEANKNLGVSSQDNLDQANWLSNDTAPESNVIEFGNDLIA